MSLLYVNTNILIKLINTFNEYDFYNMMKNNIILYFINIIINIIYINIFFIYIYIYIYIYNFNLKYIYEIISKNKSFLNMRLNFHNSY